MNLTIKIFNLPRQYSKKSIRVMNGNREFCRTNSYSNAVKIVEAFNKKPEITNTENVTQHQQIQKILSKIKEVTGIDLETDHSQKAKTINAKFIFCKIASDYGINQILIGRTIDRDHSTISHAFKKFKSYYETDLDFRETYLKCL